MPSAPQASSPSPVPPSLRAQLADASRALWMATLSLMTAFMQTAAPAHRLLLARRIARNFETLSGQECFDHGSRASFGRLAHRWQARAATLGPDGERAPRQGVFPLFR